MRTSTFEIRTNDHPGITARIAGFFSSKGEDLDYMQCSTVRGEEKRMTVTIISRGRERFLLRNLEQMHDVLSVSVDSGTAENSG